MDALESLLGVLGRLLPSATALAARSAAPVDLAGGAGKLRRHADLLFGPPPRKRAVRIMVTMPTEAAHHYQIIRDLMAAGMNVARINCAHDEPRTWKHIIRHPRRHAIPEQRALANAAASIQETRLAAPAGDHSRVSRTFL